MSAVLYNQRRHKKQKWEQGVSIAVFGFVVLSTCVIGSFDTMNTMWIWIWVRCVVVVLTFFRCGRNVAASKGGGCWRRRRWVQCTVSSYKARVEQCGPLGAKGSHGWQHMACGGQCADLLDELVGDEHAALFHRALCAAGGRGRLSDELSSDRLHSPRA